MSALLKDTTASGSKPALSTSVLNLSPSILPYVARKDSYQTVAPIEGDAHKNTKGHCLNDNALTKPRWYGVTYSFVLFHECLLAISHDA